MIQRQEYGLVTRKDLTLITAGIVLALVVSYNLGDFVLTKLEQAVERQDQLQRQNKLDMGNWM